MRVIKDFDRKNYCDTWNKFCREAVRAVIIRNGKIALVKSQKEGFYKFPGGGMEKGENHIDTLIRETMEETGLKIKPETVREFGMVREIRASIFMPDEIFEQNSYYYLAEAEEELFEPNLTESEQNLEYILEWSDIRKAYETDMEIGQNVEGAFLLREAAVLKELI